LEPRSVQEAVRLLAEHNGEIKVLAGGTDLLVSMKLRRLKPRYLVSIMKIPGLQGMSFNPESGLRIGAATTIRSLERSALIAQHYPLLSDAAKSFASVQVRNMATLGGNICSASPGADFATSLLALNTQVKIVGPDGERTASLEGFFTGPDRCAFRPDEILTEFLIPSPKPKTGSAFMKLGRVSMDLAKVNAAVVLTVDGDFCKDVSIALGAAAPTPMKARKAEAVLRGRKLTNEAIEKAAQAASAEAQPRTSFRSTAQYKREAIKVLVRHCLMLAFERKPSK